MFSETLGRKHGLIKSSIVVRSTQDDRILDPQRPSTANSVVLSHAPGEEMEKTQTPAAGIEIYSCELLLSLLIS